MVKSSGAVLLLIGALSLASGDTRTGIVHLFEWKFSDIAKECTDFLGPYGFAGVQISPPNEYVVVQNRPWWERYQPMSYEIISRSGNEQQFKDMVSTCNNAGVRIYVDVVFNHMSASDGSSAMGTSGTTTDTNSKYYANVPYSSGNFHSSCSVSNYQDANNVRNCELVGLHDLDQSQDYVRQKIIDYLNKLISYGAAGFRVDAAKHMWPADLSYIFSKVNNLNTEHGFAENSRPFIYQEVIDLGGEAIKATEYITYGANVCDFKFGNEIGRCFHGNNPLKYLTNFGTAWGLLDGSVSVVFVDNHDTQRQGGNILNYKLSKNYKMANAFMLSWGHGTPKIMSSFAFDNNDQGPPHNGDFSIADVTRNSDMTCGNGWICEHRWRQIYNMVGFANAVQGTGVNNFWSGSNNQIAYCRGNKGFIAFNLESFDLNQTIQTCLPSGSYCDVISGTKENGRCTGTTINVDGNGNAQIYLPNTSEDGVIAIHVNSKL